jgi:hypothetical protein
VITFDDARAIVAASTDVRSMYPDEFEVVEYGWENDDVFVVAVRPVVFDAPDLLVDKQTGELRRVFGLLGRDPAPGLRPIGSAPDR